MTIQDLFRDGGSINGNVEVNVIDSDGKSVDRKKYSAGLSTIDLPFYMMDLEIANLFAFKTEENEAGLCIELNGGIN